MKHWDPLGPSAPVRGVPEGCRAVPLIEVAERAGQPTEIKDRKGRLKTTQVVLVQDPVHPAVEVTEAERRFALGARRRRWPTVDRRYGAAAFETAISLVRAGLVHLACDVDSQGRVGPPRWWELTDVAQAVIQDERAQAKQRASERDSISESLAAALQEPHPRMAAALRHPTSAVAQDILIAAGKDLLAGISHAGPRAFSQAHFGTTKAHDVRTVLVSAGIPDSILEELGLRRGDRIGLGGPLVLATSGGSIDLSPLVGPVSVRLDQPELRVSTEATTAVVVENLQPAEILCVRYRELPVIYTAGQFGDDAGALIAQLHNAGTQIVAIVDADLGGVQIASRIVKAAPSANVVDVGKWPHPPGQTFPSGGPTASRLELMVDDPAIGWFASAVLSRGYPVEQELATLDIVEQLVLD